MKKSFPPSLLKSLLTLSARPKGLSSSFMHVFLLLAFSFAVLPWAYSQDCFEIFSDNTAGYSSNEATYCRTFSGYPGPEIALRLDHSGGYFHRKLTNLTADLDLFLVRGDDPSDCVANSSNGGIDEEEILIPNLPAGSYTLYIDGYQGAVGSFSVLRCQESLPPSLPDYAATALTPPATALAGESISVSYEATNVGGSAGDGTNGRDIFWIADQPDFSGFVEQLGFQPTPSLGPGQSFSGTATLSIPASLSPGDYYLLYITDADDVIEEGNTTNLLTAPIRISRPPLNCDNAFILQHLVKTPGNFTTASNNLTDYGRGANFTGREVIYRIDLPPTIWLGGNVYFDLKGDAEKLILLNSCDPTDVFAGPFIDNGTAQLLTGVEQGTYYLVVEGPLDGSDGTFELTVRRDHLRCSDARPINIGEATAPGPFSPYTYANQYCGDPNSTPLEGDEAIYEVNWPGGDFRAVLSDMTINDALPWEDAAMILLSDCEDPATCVIPPVINAGASELVMEQANLAAGTYFVVVDGVNGGFNLNFRLTINEPLPPNCDNPVRLTVGQSYSGNTAEGESNFDTYNNDVRFEHSGPEVIHTFEWEGGPAEILLSEVSADLDFMLLRSCDPTDFIATPYRTEKSDLNRSSYLYRSLEAGTYYLSVDGWQGDQGTYKLIVNRIDACEESPNRLAQEVDAPECGSTGMSSSTAAYLQQFEPAFQEFLRRSPSGARTQLRFPITAHVLRTDDGSGGLANAQTQINEGISRLNEAFAPSDISFYLCGFNEINSSQFYDFSEYEENLLFQEHYVPNTINLYVFNTLQIASSSGCFPLSGLASFPGPGNPDYVFINVASFGSTTLQHEMGHYFNLLHTHTRLHGTELVNGSNCTTTGDLICDTPADPRLRWRDSDPEKNVDENCMYFGTATDPNGEPYQPLVNNYMSYSRKECRDAFTDGQHARMRFAAENLRSYLDCATPQLADYQPTNFRARGGSSMVQAGGTIIIDLNIENKGSAAGQGNGGRDNYYLNTSPDLNGNPIFLTDFGTADIPANSLFEVNSGPLIIPETTTPGTYYIVFFHDADARIAESDETNNLAWLEITVLAPGTGLNVDFTLSDASICPGEGVRFTAQVDAGAGILYDQSGNGKNGQLLNMGSSAFVQQAKFGKALQFDGTDDYVKLPEQLWAGMEQATFETWFYSENITNWQRIFDFGVGFSSDFVSLTPASGLAGSRPAFHTSGSTADVNYPETIAPNTWYHFAITWEANGQLTLYLNGVQLGQQILNKRPADLQAYTNNLLGKEQNPNATARLNGRLDEFRIWNSVRTAEQIQANKDQVLTGNEDGLLAYYDFDAQVGSAQYTWQVEKDGRTFFTSSEANPSFTFPEPGRYRVSLTVTSGGQTATDVEHVLVDGCGLTAAFTADPTDPCLGQEVQFTAQAATPNSSQIKDASGNGNDGSLKAFGEAPFTSRAGFGQALAFDGVDDYVELPENLTANLEQFTFETWYFYEAPVTWQRIMDFGSGTSNYFFLTPNAFGGAFAPRVAIRNGDGEEQLNAPEALTAGQWYHLAVVIDGSSPTNNARLYINGDLKAQQTFTVDLTDLGNLNQNWLGRSQFPDRFLTGKLDEVRIWRTARTAEQILANKDRELVGTEDGLLVYYDFNQGTPGELSYRWSFPGGTPATSTEANPRIVYHSPGSYDVSLTVSNASGSITETKSSYLSVQACGPDWPVTQTGDNHIVVVQGDATFLLEGQALSIGDYLGAFYNDGGGNLKCAGKAQWTGENLSLVIYGDDFTTDTKDGFGAGESFQWKLWDATTGQEYFATATYQPVGGLVTHTSQYAPNGISQLIRLDGSTQPPQAASQTLNLQPGWNLVSSYIKANARDLESIFAPIKDQIAIVKNGAGQTYVPSFDINDVGNWNVVDGYQLKLLGNEAQPLLLTGIQADLDRTPIQLEQGWNLFAYLREAPQPVEAAMALVNDEVALVKDVFGNAYIPSLGINNLGELRPGQGYWARMSAEVTLTYSARLSTPPANLFQARQAPSHYRQPEPTGTNATLILQANELLAYGQEIGVFSETGTLVGAAVYEGQALAFPIWGDDATTSEMDGLHTGASFTLRAWNPTTATESELAFEASPNAFQPNGIIRAELLRTTGRGTRLQANSLRIFPNPSRQRATLRLELTAAAEVQVAIYDLSGKHLMTASQERLAAGPHELPLPIQRLSVGMYHCRVVIGGKLHHLAFGVVN